MAAPVAPARTVATPARSTEANVPMLVRPVSTDAQPGSQPLWEEGFLQGSDAGGLREGSTATPVGPEAPAAPAKGPPCPGPNEDFNELRELLHASLVKEEEQPMTPTDAFNQRMEIVIRNIKEGKVVIDSGYYTEATMRSELKFDKDRIKAVIKYCTATKARKRALTRKDKYQSHIMEYWVDVRTSGSLSQSTKEEFNQYVEIIDSGASLPPPTLGDEPLPCYEQDDDDEDDDEDDDDDDDEGEAATKTPSTKRKRHKRRGKKTPSPKSKMLAKKKKEKQEKEEVVESALEEIKNIPTVLTEVLRLRIKVDNTLEELKKSKSANNGDKLREQGDELMMLHDELAEIKAENSNKGTPSDETMKKLQEKLASVEKLSSRITMEQKKLKRCYSKGKSEFFTGIMERLADELVDLFWNGVTLNLMGKKVTFYAALLGLKGDWPIQARIGNLSRHFARKGVFQVSAKSGFCHLCRAGEQGYDANDYGSSASWRATYLKCIPWDSEGPLCRVPQSPAKEFIHKFDVFHTVHKGVFAELAGSALATQLQC
ncbi:unnamed protein product [Symbiodinium necroappetens]|uniref:Uncharacterized protein n=1 Tax=Symbiodinium necroappetens TaxID=1628268 RepID=A0A812NTB0_9DINO|nr:unnamed protein product [Symbiodinium necroappetens]